MKKLLIVIAALLLAGTACERDGVYNPKKKISEIYDEYSGSTVYQNYPDWNDTYSSPKSLSSSWTWDKNLLTKITYDVDDYAEFKYNGKRLSTVIMWDYGITLTYAYAGSKIDKIDVVMGWDGISGTYAYTYKGNKVSRIDITLNYTDDWGEYDKIHQLALPAVVCDMLAQTDKKMKQKGTKIATVTNTITVDFEWSGNNASKIKIIRKYEGQTFFTATSTCTYDNKSNPYYNAPIFGGFEISTDVFSKNNLTKVVSTSKYTWEDEPDEEPMEYTNETNYIYYYDGQFPVKQISESINIRPHDFYGTITSKRNQVTYFVYK